LGVALQLRATPLRRPVPRERLVAEYRYLCRRAARRFIRCGLDRADLEQVGAIGLIKAVDRYDASQRAPFEAYAWLLIVGELMHYVRDSERLLRAPRGVRELERRWRAAERELRALLGREPSEREVARYSAVTPAQAREIREYRASGHVISFEVLTGGEDRVPLAGIDELLDRLTVDRMLSTLRPVERAIVIAIHLDGISIVEVAARLGYSRRHVTRLHRAAMERLRRSCEVGPPRCAEARRDVSVSHGG
jgi:RNA polymerase sigma factor (sigma-70 family)